jgi:hypothetical protein
MTAEPLCALGSRAALENQLGNPGGKRRKNGGKPAGKARTREKEVVQENQGHEQSKKPKEQKCPKNGQKRENRESGR